MFVPTGLGRFARTNYWSLNAGTLSVLVYPLRSGGPLTVMDLIWGWVISRFSTAINVQRNDLRLLTSKTQTGLRSGMMKGDMRRYPVDTADCWRLCKLSAHFYLCVSGFLSSADSWILLLVLSIGFGGVRKVGLTTPWVLFTWCLNSVVSTRAASVGELCVLTH